MTHGQVSSLARPSAALWIGSAFCAALSLSGIALAALGAGERGTDVALQLSGRLSFLLFWPSYVGGPMATLFGPSFQPIRQRAREFGLAFASAHLIHLGLVGWLVHVGATPPLGTFVFFGIAVMWTYLLALFSIQALQRSLHSAGWWLLRAVGLNYIAYAFAVDFLRYPEFGSIKYWAGYLPFAVLSIIGPLLWIAAFALRAAAQVQKTRTGFSKSS